VSQLLITWLPLGCPAISSKTIQPFIDFLDFQWRTFETRRATERLLLERGPDFLDQDTWTTWEEVGIG